jgi:hypothetical protein
MTRYQGWGLSQKLLRYIWEILEKLRHLSENRGINQGQNLGDAR